MKHLKTYESINRKYKDGDYAIVFWNIRGDIEDHIVKIKEVKISGRDKGDLLVRQLNDTRNYLITPEQIIYWSEDKEELEILIASKKYNL